MSRISGRDHPQSHAHPGSDAPKTVDESPWRSDAAEEVRHIRSAVTNREDGPVISDAVAPMMSEFLDRLDHMRDQPPARIAPPNGLTSSMGPLELAEVVRDAVEALGALEAGDAAAGGEAVVEMIDEVREFLNLRQECIARTNASQ